MPRSSAVIYLDHNATAPLDPRVLDAMLPYLRENYGNASSIHGAGRRARDAVERARREVAAAVGAEAEEIVFTSGGTEANNLALHGAARGRAKIVSSALEHPSVLEVARALGLPLELVPVSPEGQLELAGISAGADALVALQLANHEIGTVNPIAEIRARFAGAFVHTDAVQAAGKLPIDLHALGVDSASLSAHKIGGPKGVGALYVARGRKLEPHVRGGRQERERRAGSENVAGIVGFGCAARLATEELASRTRKMAVLRDRLERGLRALGASVHADSVPRVPGTSNVGWPGMSGELVVMNLDLDGIACSTGAACSSGSVEPSPVLLALGLGREQARAGVRFSIGWENTEDEIDQVLARLPAILQRIKRA